MRKRALPSGRRCRRRNVSISDPDWEYLQRLAREAREAGRPREHWKPSGQIRLALRDRRAKRHDLPSAQFTVKLAAEALKPGVPRREVRQLLEEAVVKIERIRADDSTPATTPAVHTPAARTSASSARGGAPGAGRRAAG